MAHIEAHASVSTYGSLTAEVRRFYERLVDAAEKMADDSEADSFSFANGIVGEHLFGAQESTHFQRGSTKGLIDENQTR